MYTLRTMIGNTMIRGDRPAEEIEITPEMIEVGVRAIFDYLPDVVFVADGGERLVKEIFAEMYLASKKPR